MISNTIAAKNFSLSNGMQHTIKKEMSGHHKVLFHTNVILLHIGSESNLFTFTGKNEKKITPNQTGLYELFNRARIKTKQKERRIKERKKKIPGVTGRDRHSLEYRQSERMRDHFRSRIGSSEFEPVGQMRWADRLSNGLIMKRLHLHTKTLFSLRKRFHRWAHTMHNGTRGLLERSENAW